ncbi:MAG: FkbM family methyltransferase [Acetobacteraceae bacterium]|jgi:FkbM family methyltransferase
MTEVMNMSRRLSQPVIIVPQPSSDSEHVRQTLVDAISHHHAGRVADAERHYRTLIESPSGHALASYGLGLLCATQGRPLEAIDAYRDAIARRPDFADAYVNLGTTVLALGQCEEAALLYRQAIAINPENAMAHSNLGKALQDQGRCNEALEAYRAAISLQPDDASININFGAALLEQRTWEEAVTVTQRAIALQPANAMAHANLGTALMNLGRHEEALESCYQAMGLDLQGVAIHASLGGAMLELGALPEAVDLCQRAIALDPTLASAHFNLSHALKAMNLLEAAQIAVGQAISLCPDSAEYHFHLAHILLLRGDLAAGWAEYDWRWKLPDFSWISTLHGEFTQPPWFGEDIGDKTILIHTEQGLGDMILFARYLPLVVQSARRVIAAVSPRMHRLLESIEGVEVVSIRDVPLPDFDVHCPLLSLPRAFATRLGNIPSPVRYLRAEPAAQEDWANRIKRSQTCSNTLRVGLVWAGNPATKRDRFRSPGLASVAPLFSVSGIEFVVLQVGEGRQELDASPLPPGVIDLGCEVTDLADTAAIISGLDLMISSCTAPLHLAGALGVPTWAMIPFAPYFPWLLERTDTPWYPSMRLYRQEQPGRDWSGVVARIAADLAALVHSTPDCPGVQQRHVSENTLSMPQMSLPEIDGFNQLARCRSGVMLCNRNDTYIGASLRKYGEFSGEETALFRLIVQPGRTVLDIGANIGVHTVDLSCLVGPDGTVHSFEPQRLTFQLLCANVALNSCSNVFTHHTAVGAAAGTILVPSLDPGESHNYGGLSLLGSGVGEPVALVTIDSMELSDCQFIKIDIEGMETEALRGAAVTIQQFRPFLYVENDRQGRSAELIGLLQQYGYRLYWHTPPLYSANNFRVDMENIFGSKVSVNMIGIPAEIPQFTVVNLREVAGPTDSVIRW